MSKLIVCVGSTNPNKISATKSIFTAQFTGSALVTSNEDRVMSRAFDSVEVHALDVTSSVSATPMSDEEAIAGALHRAQESIKHIKELYGESSSLFGVGLEAGLSPYNDPLTKQQKYFLCTWAVVVVTNKNEIGLGSSARAPLTDNLMSKFASNSNGEMKEVLSAVSGVQEVGKSVGGIHFLTDGQITRENLNEQALYCALSPFTSPKSFH